MLYDFLNKEVNLWLRLQIYMQGLPFNVKLNYREPLDLGSMTRNELQAELEKGYQSALSGDVKPADKVFESLHKEFGL